LHWRHLYELQQATKAAELQERTTAARHAYVEDQVRLGKGSEVQRRRQGKANVYAHFVGALSLAEATVPSSLVDAMSASQALQMPRKTGRGKRSLSSTQPVIYRMQASHSPAPTQSSSYSVLFLTCSFPLRPWSQGRGTPEYPPMPLPGRVPREAIISSGLGPGQSRMERIFGSTAPAMTWPAPEASIPPSLHPSIPPSLHPSIPPSLYPSSPSPALQPSCPP
jgi:hypothetical protein